VSQHNLWELVAPYKISKETSQQEALLTMKSIRDFCCQNPDYPDYGMRAKDNLRLHDLVKRQPYIFFCKTCQSHFGERKGTV
jgi:hypothetical protein